MEIKNRTIWQQSAGDTDRNYANVCLTWDVILTGPGYAGEWPGCKKILQNDKWSSCKCADLHRFCEEMQSGDLVVLRLGASKVFGVGEVVGNYMWSDLFGDVDGWDLQHVRRVRWFLKNSEQPEEFPAHTMKLGGATQRLDSVAVKEWIRALTITPADQARELETLPMPGLNTVGNIRVIAGSLELLAEREKL